MLSDEERTRAYLERIGDRTRVAQLTVDPAKITQLDLDHRAGFLISMIDGIHSIDDLLDVAAMPRVETLEILVDLLDRGIVR